MPLVGGALMQRIAKCPEENAFDETIVSLSNFLDQMNECLIEYDSTVEIIFSNENLSLRTADMAKNSKKTHQRTVDIRTARVQTSWDS